MFITNFLNSTDPIITKIHSFVAPVTRGDETMPDAPAKKGLPGFEGVFAIAGLLAIAYVLVRQKR